MFARIFSANGFFCFPCLPNPSQQRWGQAPRTNSSGSVVGYSLRKLLKRGRRMALPLRNNTPLGTVSEGAGSEKPPACRDEARWLIMSGLSDGPKRPRPGSSFPGAELRRGHLSIGCHERGSLWVMSCGDIITLFRRALLMFSLGRGSDQSVR